MSDSVAETAFTLKTKVSCEGLVRFLSKSLSELEIQIVLLPCAF